MRESVAIRKLSAKYVLNHERVEPRCRWRKRIFYQWRVARRAESSSAAE